VSGVAAVAAISVSAERRRLQTQQQRSAAAEDLDGLGTEPIELPGDHSPFLSRPSALAEVLLHVADGI